MKHYLAVLGIFLTITQAFAAEVVVSCDVGSRPYHRVNIVRDAPLADTQVYFIEYDGKRTPLFADIDQSRGSDVLAQCAGKRVRALIVSGEFTANALQGFVIAGVAPDGKLDRMDFAEKNRPQRLYLSTREIVVVVPTLGYGETSAKYVAYRHRIGTQAGNRMDAINRLPAVARFELVTLNAPAR